MPKPKLIRESHTCDCGRPAESGHRVGNDWVCDRCWRIDQMDAADLSRTHKARKPLKEYKFHPLPQ